MRKPTIGLGVLSWNAHATLRKTLASYQKENLTSAFDQSVIYFSDFSNEDQAIADEFGFEAFGGPNKGIASGSQNLVQRLDTDYVLVVQNDNSLVECLPFVEQHLEGGLDLLECGKADVVRMRHRFMVGEGFSDVINYLKMHPLSEADPDFVPGEHDLRSVETGDSLNKRLKRLLRPGKSQRMKGRSIHIEKTPQDLYPEVISKVGGFFIADSSVINFSDQCFLTSKGFFLDVLMKRVQEHPSKRTLNGFQVPEICLNSRWWRRQHFKIAQGRGIFTHDRCDGSFRANHHTRVEHGGVEPLK